MLVSCPHCKTDLEVTPELYGQTVQCPACQGRLQIPKMEEKATATSPAKPQRAGWEEKDHANVDFVKSLLYGIAGTVGILLLMVPLRGNGIGAIFLDRGWVNYAETFLFVWGIAILVMKWKKNQHQAQATLLQLFPERLVLLS